MNPPSWEELSIIIRKDFPDSRWSSHGEFGPMNTHADIRLFDSPSSTVPDVVLYRDHHYWCPYCQRVQLYLELQRIPYRIKKINMHCYGERETWYRQLVPSGIIPALSFESVPGKIYSDSESIIEQLEIRYGPLGVGINDKESMSCRQLEKKLFKEWCVWLSFPDAEEMSYCQASNGDTESEQQKYQAHESSENAKVRFIALMKEFESIVKSPFIFGKEISTVDVMYAPFLERMLATLFYYKGYNMIQEHKKFAAWFSHLQTLSESYQGIMGDFHTHCHSLPPQIGGIYFSVCRQARENIALVDCEGPSLSAPLVGFQVDPSSYPEPPDSRYEAAFRVIKHHSVLTKINPYGTAAADFGLRLSLSRLLNGNARCTTSKSDDTSLSIYDISGSDCSTEILHSFPHNEEYERHQAPPFVAAALRHIKQRVCVPRDMPVWSAMRLRDALEMTAAAFGTHQGKPIGVTDRYDQNPAPFQADLRHRLSHMNATSRQNHHLNKHMSSHSRGQQYQYPAHGYSHKDPKQHLSSVPQFTDSTLRNHQGLAYNSNTFMHSAFSGVVPGNGAINNRPQQPQPFHVYHQATI